MNNLKEHLVNLLLEQFKQELFYEQLEEYGIRIDNYIIVNNLDIVCDIIGFPPDNTLEYDFEYLNSPSEEMSDGNKKLPDEKIFCRDYLLDKYPLIKDEFIDQNIFVSEKGITIDNEINSQKIKNEFTLKRV